MTPRTKEQNDEIRLRRLVQIRKAAADVFLNKGPLLEIRDVAAQAGLGYGTVYHYYSNKNDLLHDLLWDALARAGGWMEAPRETGKIPPEARLEAPQKVPRASASGPSPAIRPFGMAAAAVSANSDDMNSPDGSRETAVAAAPDPIADAAVRLLQLWAEDHALYLLYKHAGEGFAALPEARSAPLSAAFRREVLEPLAALLETGRPADGAADSGGDAAGLLYRQQHAEMLLAALAGCAALSLRRGKLYEEARAIARFLKL